MSRNHRWKALFPILQMTKNMTAKELHKKTKGRVSLSTIKNWKSGRVSYPRFETMQTVLISLGYTFDIVPNKVVSQSLKAHAKQEREQFIKDNQNRLNLIGV